MSEGWAKGVEGLGALRAERRAGRPPGWAHRAQLEADRVRACEYTHRDSDLQAMLSISLGDFNLRLIYLLDLQLIEESSTSVTFIFK